jgi:hypothetical protein
MRAVTILVLRQELELLRGARSAEDRVAVGKAPEALDDREVALGVTEGFAEAADSNSATARN